MKRLATLETQKAKKDSSHLSLSIICFHVGFNIYLYSLGGSTLGWGPKVKIGQINKILWIQLGLYIRKPGEKSLTQKKLILIRGIALEKNGPCSWENEVKISTKKTKWPKITFRGPILVPKVSFWGF